MMVLFPMVFVTFQILPLFSLRMKILDFLVKEVDLLYHFFISQMMVFLGLIEVLGQEFFLPYDS